MDSGRCETQMAKKLVIVESPAKAKTIEKFLGADFEVRASMGHIMDLPKKGMGVTLPKKGKQTASAHDFEPKYEVIEKKEKLISELKAAAKKAETVYLAPDPDREGEFIAWSLKSALDLRAPQRAVFNEITSARYKMPSATRESLTKTCSMLSRPAACWTGWWDIRSARCSGGACNQGPAPGACSRWRCA